MVRSVIWISSFALSAAFACDLAEGQTHSSPTKRASAQTGGWKARTVTGNESPRAADYVVETPGDEEIDVDANPQTDIQSGFPDQDLEDEPKTEIIKERFPTRLQRTLLLAEKIHHRKVAPQGAVGIHSILAP